jgi:uncharacterized membrane protein
MTIDYLSLRRAVGVLGCLLPWVLIAIAGEQPSLSAYYYTPARDVFVGLLFVIAALLGAYRGYDRGDRICSALAAVALVLVALAPVGGAWHWLHLGAALAFFLAVAELCRRFAFGGYRPRTFHTLAGVIWLALVAAVLGAPLLLAEAVAVVAFGVAWLVKGRSIEALAGP